MNGSVFANFNSLLILSETQDVTQDKSENNMGELLYANYNLASDECGLCDDIVT